MMRPTVAVVAAEDPEIAANIVHPSTLTWRSRPGRRVVHGASPVKRDVERREWKRISAIRMKSGSAMSSGVVVTFQVSCASSFSIGMLRNRAETDETRGEEREPDPHPEAEPDREHHEDDGGGEDGHRFIRPRTPAAPLRPRGGSPARRRIARATS